MIIKKNKKLYILIFILHLITFRALTNDLNNENENIVENKNNLIINNNKDVSFDIYKNIIESLMKLFSDTMQISMENNKSQEEIITFLETIGINKIQPIIIKYMNNLKNHKLSKPLEPISLDDLKLFLTFLYNFIISINNKEIESINITDINSIEELIKTIEILNQKNTSQIKTIKKITLHEFDSTIDSFIRLINSIIILTNNILTNLRKGKYINHGIYNSIMHPGKKNKSKYNQAITTYQNEFLFPKLQHLSNELQKKSLILHDIKNLPEDISEKRFKQIIQELFSKILKDVSLLEYFLIESKFYPKNKKFLINDEKIINEENNYIKKKSNEYYQKLTKKYNIDTISLNNLNKDKILKNIESINGIVVDCIKIEFELTLFKFQNYYRKSIFYLEKIMNSNDFTKFCKTTLAPENWLALIASWVGVDFYLWLSNSKSSGFWQSITKVFIDVKRFIDNGGTGEGYDFIIPTIHGVKEHYYKIHNALNSNFKECETTKGNMNEKTDRENFITSTTTKPNTLTTAKPIKHLFEDGSFNTFLNQSPYLNEQKLWCEETLTTYNDILNKKESISKENEDIDKISLHIDYSILNAWNPENELKKCCEDNGIKNLNQLDKIIKIHKEKESFEKKTAAQLKIYTEGWVKNNRRNSIETALNGVYGGTLAAGIGIGFATKLLGDSLIEKGITHYPSKFWSQFHYFMMGERSSMKSDETREIIDSDNSSGPSSLFDDTFNVLSSQGALVWFKEMLNFIKLTLEGELYTGSEKITKCIGLFGPSGSGKTAVIKAFGNDIHRIIKENKSNIEVEFLNIDPKHFNGIINDGKKIQLDVIAELDKILEGIKVKGGFYIVHLDEFHLYFTKDGKVSQEKLADLLKFFNDLFVKQKTFKRIGGMYVICSTNKPQFIPHEFFDNGDRIGETYEIKYPNGEQIISILKQELLHNNVLIDHIDFDYLAPLLEECNLTYGTIIKIANKAFNTARIQGKTIDNNILYYSINDVVRKINFNGEEDNIKKGEKNSVALYYSALASLAINFAPKHNSIYDLDMITILPLKQDYSPEHIDRLYLKPEKKITKIGEAFYAKKNNNDIYSKEAIAIEIIKAIAPTVYLDSENIPKINKQSELADIYSKLYNFYATKVSFSDCAKRIDIARQKRSLSQDIYISDFNDTYSNQDLHNHIIQILTNTEKQLKEFYKNEEVKIFIKEISNLLIENKIVTKQDIFNNHICSSQIEKLNILFDDLFLKILNEIK